MGEWRREAFFVDALDGGRFAILLRPSGHIRGCVLQIPPFAEELNKSRRMLAQAAAAFAEAGWAVLQLDLLGTGDSAGDFGDASWAAWLDDLERGRDLLLGLSTGPLVLWSLRAGSLLASAWMARCGVRPPLLAWQPVLQGRQHLQQFLRLKGVSEMLNDADAGKVMAELRADLAAGRTVEVAGYALAPELVSGLEAARLEVAGDPVLLLEVNAAEAATPSPALLALTTRWRAGGDRAEAAVVAGPAFWQTQEIECAPALVEASLPWLEGLR